MKKLEKRKEQILKETEKKYLSEVIRPYDINCICKKRESITENYEFIIIKLNGELMNNEIIKLPYFKKGTMYKGMEIDKEYTLKELGLE